MPPRPTAQLLLDTPEAVVTISEMRLGRNRYRTADLRQVATDETHEIRPSGSLVCSLCFFAAGTLALSLMGLGALGPKWLIAVVLGVGIGLAAMQDALQHHRTTLYRLWLDSGRGSELAFVTTDPALRDAIVRAIGMIGRPRAAVDTMRDAA